MWHLSHVKQMCSDPIHFSDELKLCGQITWGRVDLNRDSALKSPCQQWVSNLRPSDVIFFIAFSRLGSTWSRRWSASWPRTRRSSLNIWPVSWPSPVALRRSGPRWSRSLRRSARPTISSSEKVSYWNFLGVLCFRRRHEKCPKLKNRFVVQAARCWRRV